MRDDRQNYRDDLRTFTEAQSPTASHAFAEIYDDLPAIAAMLDERGIILGLSRECSTRFGDVSRFLGRSLVSLAHNDDRDELRNALKAAVGRRNHIEHCEFRIWRGRRDPVPVRMSLRAASTGEGPTMLLGVASDVSDRLMLEEQLLERTTELSDMASQLLAAQDQERRRIAADMHDTIGHQLAVAKFQMDGLRHLELDGQALATVDSAIEQLQQAIDAVRSLTFSLNSTSLHDQGLDAAIEDFGQTLSQNQAFDFSLSSRPRNRRLSQPARITLYRIVRELLINALKHASASHIRVSIGADDNDMHFAVVDDGVGLNQTTLKCSSGTGLRSVEQQLSALDGCIKFENRDSGGTMVRFSVPYSSVGSEV
ncbi:MAG: PAS domain S-box protein [Gammaproteobacteria bacterium]|nr:PAS domain S-box protein [Gammaproteobacteria bacterium]